MNRHKHIKDYLYTIRCPTCKVRLEIDISDNIYYWIAGTVWMCPNCKNKHTTK